MDDDDSDERYFGVLHPRVTKFAELSFWAYDALEERCEAETEYIDSLNEAIERTERKIKRFYRRGAEPHLKELMEMEKERMTVRKKNAEKFLDVLQVQSDILKKHLDLVEEDKEIYTQALEEYQPFVGEHNTLLDEVTEAERTYIQKKKEYDWENNAGELTEEELSELCLEVDKAFQLYTQKYEEEKETRGDFPEITDKMREVWKELEMKHVEKLFTVLKDLSTNILALQDEHISEYEDSNVFLEYIETLSADIIVENIVENRMVPFPDPENADLESSDYSSSNENTSSDGDTSSSSSTSVTDSSSSDISSVTSESGEETESPEKLEKNEDTGSSDESGISEKIRAYMDYIKQEKKECRELNKNYNQNTDQNRKKKKRGNGGVEEHEGTKDMLENNEVNREMISDPTESARQTEPICDNQDTESDFTCVTPVIKLHSTSLSQELLTQEETPIIPFNIDCMTETDDSDKAGQQLSADLQQAHPEEGEHLFAETRKSTDLGEQTHVENISIVPVADVKIQEMHDVNVPNSSDETLEKQTAINSIPERLAEGTELNKKEHGNADNSQESCGDRKVLQ